VPAFELLLLDAFLVLVDVVDEDVDVESTEPPVERRDDDLPLGGETPCVDCCWRDSNSVDVREGDVLLLLFDSSDALLWCELWLVLGVDVWYLSWDGVEVSSRRESRPPSALRKR
jgi:hypothetical protein